MERCIADIVKQSGVSQDEAAEILDQAMEQKTRIEAEAGILDIDRKLNNWAETSGTDLEYRAALQERRALQNIVMREKWDAHLARLMEGNVKDVSEALMGKLLGSHKAADGARLSVSGKKIDLETVWSGRIFAEIQGKRPHVFKLLLRDKEFRRDLLREMFYSDFDAFATENKDAQWLARVLADVSNASRNRLNKAGARILRLKGWVPQRHDMARMRQAGKERWVKMLLDRDLLDMERTFRLQPGEMWSRAQFEDALGRAYDEIVSGGDVHRVTNWQELRMTGPANLAEELSDKHRVLFFKDADEWLAYADEFGSDNVFDAVLGTLRTRATQAALLEEMGTNPEAFLTHYVKHLRQRIWADPNLDDEAKHALAKKLPRDLSEPKNKISIAWKVVSGQSDIPGNVTFAKVASFARSWTSMAKLGMATLSSVTDLATAAARMRFQGGSLLDGYARMFGGLLEGPLTPEKKEIAHLLGVGFDSMLGDIHARFMAEDHVHGKASRAQQIFFKLSLLTPWTERNRTTFALMSSAHMAQRTALPWDELGDAYRHNLTVHGIDESAWNVIRKLDKRGADGRDYIVPEAVGMLRDEDLEEFVAGPLAEHAALAGDRAEREIAKGMETKLRGLEGRARGQLSKDFEAYFSAKKGRYSPKEMAEMVRFSWDQLDPRVQEHLEKHGLGPAHWSVVPDLVKGGGPRPDAPDASAMSYDEVDWPGWQIVQGRLDPESIRKTYGKQDGAAINKQITRTFGPGIWKRKDDASVGLDELEEMLRNEGFLGQDEELVHDFLMAGVNKGDNREKYGLPRVRPTKAKLWKRVIGRVPKVDVKRIERLPQEALDRFVATERATLETTLRSRWKSKNLIATRDKRIALLRDARQDLHDRLHAYFLDETDSAVLRPDDRTRMWQTSGLKPGTIWGEAARTMMQFKSFPISFSQRVLGAHLWGGQGGKPDLGGLAHLIASTTVLGYLAMTMKDLAKGKEPRDPKNFNTWLAAFMQGGGAGIYGDFLLGKYSRFGGGVIETLEGPTIGALNEILTMGARALHGEFDGGEALYTAVNNTPFINLFYTRQVLDWLVIYHLQEMASPGYLKRQAKRIKETYNQEFIVPPHEKIKRGGWWR